MRRTSGWRRCTCEVSASITLRIGTRASPAISSTKGVADEAGQQHRVGPALFEVPHHVEHVELARRLARGLGAGRVGLLERALLEHQVELLASARRRCGLHELEEDVGRAQRTQAADDADAFAKRGKPWREL